MWQSVRNRHSEYYLEHGTVSEQTVRELIHDRHVFPCYFGSALKLDRVDKLLKGLEQYAYVEKPEHEFGARVFKISRDEQDNRLTWLSDRRRAQGKRSAGWNFGWRRLAGKGESDPRLFRNKI